jgi:hypothetical protein
MKLYRFSPIKSQRRLLRAIEYIHFSCHELCKNTFGKYLQNAGNVGVFCHYDEEYGKLVKLRNKLTESSNEPNQKYFRFYEPVVIPAKEDVPETTYTHLYVRRPDPYRHQVGDIDFYLEPTEYQKLRDELLAGKKLSGARIFERPDLDMIELYNPDIDALAYVSTKKMTEIVRIKQSDITKL